MKLVLGVNNRFVPPTMLTTPFVATALVMVNGSPSTSVAFTNGRSTTLTSSSVSVKSFTATGASSTGVTVIETVPVAVNEPSLTVKVKLSGPW